ncbi:hypothetical protein [Sphingobium chlorophenolicum]|uniref:hypothetical protein n=1 Tax=Sphingobium chlorophenolicum TaxID=46429 RepID=UPI00059E9D1E|nr:hypothetical protein [Sphingobium chlorophenolicum]
MIFHADDGDLRQREAAAACRTNETGIGALVPGSPARCSRIDYICVLPDAGTCLAHLLISTRHRRLR